MINCITGVDIGTGSTKAVATDARGKVIAAAQFYYSTGNPQPGYSEQDPEVIWQAFVNCLSEIIQKLPRLSIAVSLSSAMHSLIVMNDKNTATTPLITWADTRSEKIAESIRRSPEAEKIYRTTGTPIHSMSPLCKIKWLKENEPEIFNSASKFISIKEFIWYRLFHEYEVDYSIASATGLLDITTLNWSMRSLELCGISASHLSRIVSTGFTRQDPDLQLTGTNLIPAGTVFCIGASDGCLANVGSYAMAPGTAALTIGTSGAVRIAGNTPVNNYEAMIFNYVLDKNTFISGGPVNNGGNILKWLFETFLKIKDPSENDYQMFFETIEAIPAGSHGLLFLPYLHGERAPIWDEKASGVYLGIRSFHTNAHFLRAALEGVCFALKNILEILEVSTAPINQLNVSGGFVHSETWMHMLADVTNKKICLDQAEDASSLGAALFYMKAYHIINDYTSLSPAPKVTIDPAAGNHLLYEKYYGIYKNLYKKISDSMHELQDINQG